MTEDEILKIIKSNTPKDAAKKIKQLFDISNNGSYTENKSSKDNEFSMHQHWKDDSENENDGGTIKHFQDQ